MRLESEADDGCSSKSLPVDLQAKLAVDQLGDRSPVNQPEAPVNRSLTLSPQKRLGRALRAMKIRSCAPTSDLCENARGRRQEPGTRKTPQKQAHQRAADLPAPPPLLNTQPHPSWWGTQGGSPLSPLDEHLRTPCTIDLLLPSGWNGSCSWQRSLLSQKTLAHSTPASSVWLTALRYSA